MELLILGGFCNLNHSVILICHCCYLELTVFRFPIPVLPVCREWEQDAQGVLGTPKAARALAQRETPFSALSCL